MRDVYIWFSIIYFIAGGVHLYLMYRMVKSLENKNG